MSTLSRRNFLITSSALPVSLWAGKSGGDKIRFGLVPSNHSRLRHPASPEDPLDYLRVRDMVWKAIEYGRPRAGSLEAKIKPGSWVVIKPNIVGLRLNPFYRTGDVTDFRVTKAVLEYVASRSKAGRITVAEGGSYRRPGDPEKDNVCMQDGVHVDARTFDWGTEEFPGFKGSLGEMIAEAQREFPGKKIDYVDLSYDAIRDPSGKFQRIEVAKSPNGVGAFGGRPDYFVTNTICNCDFLISVPVMKVHLQSGITCCLKNYVGTAPREAYGIPGAFHNANLHSQHSVEGRICPFITDLASFHPPDYVVVDAVRGLQHHEHNIDIADQMIRSNLIFAGEDSVAGDAIAARLMGFNEQDMEFLQMAQQRGMGTLDLGKIEVVGAELDRYVRRWGKPKNWYGRGNREWRITRDPNAPMSSWARQTIPTDTLHFDQWAGGSVVTGTVFAAAVKVQAEGHRKSFLWVGTRGKVTATLNGEQVMTAENRTKYRIGQFQQAVELKPGENLLTFRVEALRAPTDLSALLVSPHNDGDTVEGIRWMA